MKTYLMWDGEKLYKIGKSKNPKSRLEGLKTANPKISLIAFGEGNNETFLHNKYSDKRYAREWFLLTEDDVKDIKIFFKQRQDFFKEVSCTITFGKFRGLQLSELVQEYHIKYMNWYIVNSNDTFWINLFKKQISRAEKLIKKNKKYKKLKGK